MPLTNTEIQYTFKVVGKAIKLGVVGAVSADDYEAFSSVTNRQISPSGIAREYDEVKYVGSPIQQVCESVASVGLSLKENMKTVVGAYLQNALALDLGLAAGTNPNTVAAALAAAMTAGAQTVGSSGAKTVDTSFAVYFYNNFGAVLPQSASPTCPDTWITSVMVP